MKYSVITLSLLLMLSAPTAFGQSSQEGTGETDGYVLVWQDLFDGDELNELRWNIEVNGAGGGNNELQYYTDRATNVHVGDDGKGNGCLILTAHRESYGGKSFTSGRVNSKNLVAFKHGKIEAAIRMPKTANGLWPAFWMMGNDYDAVGWPKCGETDIVEMGHQNAFAAGNQEKYFNGAMHWGQGWPNASYARDTTKSYSLQDGEFHIFTAIWDENSMSMYIDLDQMPVQTPYFKMDIPCTEPDNEWSPGNYFHKENFILFNLAVGGNFPGIYNADEITALNDANGQEASMYVNYVKIYQKGTADESIYMAVPGDDPSGITDFADEADRMISISAGIACCRDAEMTIYNTAGQMVCTGFGRVDLSSLPSGIYIIYAMTPSGRRLSSKVIL
ncbi:MAG: family 16 glycosylhydrolase [Muribaculaceae bacterium]|nr:family 16 glycosylhydrolase [Muribaculaceae bacterium]